VPREDLRHIKAFWLTYSVRKLRCNPVLFDDFLWPRRRGRACIEDSRHHRDRKVGRPPLVDFSPLTRRRSEPAVDRLPVLGLTEVRSLTHRPTTTIRESLPFTICVGTRVKKKIGVYFAKHAMALPTF
jgi:hypothetical protein